MAAITLFILMNTFGLCLAQNKIYLNAKYSPWYDWDNPDWCNSRCDLVDSQEEADTVIWNIVHPKHQNVGPKGHQTWVVNTYFEPPTDNRLIHALNGQIDYIYGYRRDSDFLETRVATVTTDNNVESNVDAPKLFTWAVSNCRSKRMDYYHVLYESMTVSERERSTVFGKCFDRPNPCGNSGPQGTGEDPDCFRRLMKSHKFYLAFENSRHRDYISEKVTKAYEFGMIPIVWGGESKLDYEMLLPKHSFIHVDDFETPAALMEYVRYLDQNETAYREHFSTTQAVVGYGFGPSVTYDFNKWEMCLLCDQLNGNGRLEKRGPDFDLVKWWLI